jgi:LacI family transcriptional regulator
MRAGTICEDLVTVTETSSPSSVSPMGTTMRAVAEHAGVSIKTVSRVVNDDSQVRPQLRERVRRSISELNYSPDASARALVNRRISIRRALVRRSCCIGVPFDAAFNSFPITMYGDSLETDRLSIRCILFACNAESTNIANKITSLAEHVAVDGLLLHPPLCEMDELLDALDRRNIPFVRVDAGKRTDLSRSVFTDERDACAAAIKHLCDLGHTKIASMAGHPNHPGVQRRYLGYCDGMKRAGLRLDAQLLIRSDGTFESVMAGARHLLDRRASERPTAILATDDEIAAGALLAARDLRISVPGELSIVGFGNLPIASRLWPTLTTIQYPAANLAHLASRLFASQVHNESPELRVHLSNCPLVIRCSTSAASAR